MASYYRAPEGEICGRCFEGRGYLFKCSMCSSGFHLRCLGLEVAPSDKTWKCSDCLSERSRARRASSAVPSQSSSITDDLDRDQLPRKRAGSSAPSGAPAGGSSRVKNKAVRSTSTTGNSSSGRDSTRNRKENSVSRGKTSSRERSRRRSPPRKEVEERAKGNSKIAKAIISNPAKAKKSGATTTTASSSSSSKVVREPARERDRGDRKLDRGMSRKRKNDGPYWVMEDPMHPLSSLASSQDIRSEALPEGEIERCALLVAAYKAAISALESSYIKTRKTHTGKSLPLPTTVPFIGSAGGVGGGGGGVVTTLEAHLSAAQANGIDLVNGGGGVALVGGAGAGKGSAAAANQKFAREAKESLGGGTAGGGVLPPSLLSICALAAAAPPLPTARGSSSALVYPHPLPCTASSAVSAYLAPPPAQIARLGLPSTTPLMRELRTRMYAGQERLNQLCTLHSSLDGNLGWGVGGRVKSSGVHSGGAGAAQGGGGAPPSSLTVDTFVSKIPAPPPFSREDMASVLLKHCQTSLSLTVTHPLVAATILAAARAVGDVDGNSTTITHAGGALGAGGEGSSRGRSRKGGDHPLSSASPSFLPTGLSSSHSPSHSPGMKKKRGRPASSGPPLLFSSTLQQSSATTFATQATGASAPVEKPLGWQSKVILPLATNPVPALEGLVFLL